MFVELFALTLLYYVYTVVSNRSVPWISIPLPIIGHLRHFVFNKTDLFKWIIDNAKHPIQKINIVKNVMYWVTDKDLAQQIFSHPNIVRAKVFNDAHEFIFGGVNVGNASTLNGDHQWRRNVLVPMFTPRALDKVNDYMDYRISKIDLNDDTDIAGQFRLMNIKVMIMHIFETDSKSLGITDAHLVDLMADMAISTDYMDYLPRLIPYIGKSRMLPKIKTINDATLRSRVFARKLLDAFFKLPLKDTFIHKYFDLCRDYEECIEVTIAMLFVGHDTTSHLASFTLYELARNPRWQDLCRQEIERNDDSHEYVNAIIKESLRMHPVGSVSIMDTTGSVQLDKYTIPANRLVVIDIRSINKQMGDEFDPTRWLNGNTPKGFYGFSSGKHACFGRQLVMKTLRKIVARCLTGKRIESDSELEIKVKMTLQPAKILKFKFVDI